MCGGISTCEHDRMRSVYKDSTWASICEHGREKYKCKECGDVSVCEYGRQRSQCKECNAGKGSKDVGVAVFPVQFVFN